MFLLPLQILSTNTSIHVNAIMHHAWKRERHYMYPTTKRTLLGLVSSNRM